MPSWFMLQDFVLALALIQGEPETSVPAFANTPSVRLQMQQLAVKLEVLDPREVRYVLARQEDFTSDVKLIRRRMGDLRDAPSVSDSMRFPPRDVVNDWLSFNRSYRQHLEMAQVLYPASRPEWWWYQAARSETDALYQIYDHVRDSRCEYYYVTVRRQALLKLRDALGPEAYYAGRLPPHVPLWRFRVID